MRVRYCVSMKIAKPFKKKDFLRFKNTDYAVEKMSFIIETKNSTQTGKEVKETLEELVVSLFKSQAKAKGTYELKIARMAK